MLKETNNLKRMWVIGALLTLLVIMGTQATIGEGGVNPGERVAHEQWEYLAVAGPSPANVEESRLRKEPNVPFRSEAYALEQQLDKLGANCWELVAVAGPPTDPAFYFKRRK